MDIGVDSFGLRKTPPSTGTAEPPTPSLDAPNASAALPSPAHDTLAKKPSPHTAHRVSLVVASSSNVVRVAFRNDELAGTLSPTGSRQVKSWMRPPPEGEQ